MSRIGRRKSLRSNDAKIKKIWLLRTYYAIKKNAKEIYHPRREIVKGDIDASDRKANGMTRQGERHWFDFNRKETWDPAP
jgi:hypothetical protein